MKEQLRSWVRALVKWAFNYHEFWTGMLSYPNGYFKTIHIDHRTFGFLKQLVLPVIEAKIHDEFSQPDPQKYETWYPAHIDRDLKVVIYQQERNQDA